MKQTTVRLGKKIGSGFFGDVYLGKDPIHGRVAVKVLRRPVGASASDWNERKNALLEEGQHLSRADGKHVVRVFHVRNQAGGPMLVMQFCENGSFQDRFEAGPLGIAVVRRAAEHLLLGLESLHARGMLHRDIKPGNVLEDGARVVKLGDFGLVTDDIVLGYASQAGYSDHLAPEIHAGSGTTQQTDVWAVGMTLYRLLHGEAWYQRFPPPRETIPLGGFAKKLVWLPHVPPDWRRMIRKALHDDRSQRIANAHEFLNQLARLKGVGEDWECEVTPSNTTWVRRHGGTEERVELTGKNTRQQWKATVTNLATTKTRNVGKGKARIGLDAFFAKRR